MAQSTPTYGVDAWEWQITAVPTGSASGIGVNVDFTDGLAAVQAAQFNADVQGIYTVTVRSHDVSGWSYPVTVEILVVTSGTVLAEANLATHSIGATAPLTGGGALNTNPTVGITQATAGTDGYVTLAKYNAWDDKMDNPMTVMGDMIYGGAGMPATPTRLNVGAATEVLHGGATPSFGQVVEADLDLSDNVTANATAVQHGFAPRLSGAAGEYLNGVGAWTTPAGVTSAYTTIVTNVGGGGGNVNVVHNFGAYPLVQVLIGGVVTPPGVGTVTSITHNTVNDFTVAYSGAAVGHIIASLGSPQAQLVVATGVNRNVLLTDYYVKATAAGIFLHLPTAVGNAGRTFVCDNGAIGNITVDCIVGGQTIEGEASQDVPPDCALVAYSDGANYRIA